MDNFTVDTIKCNIIENKGQFIAEWCILNLENKSYIKC